MAFASSNFVVNLKRSLNIRRSTRNNTLSFPIWPVNLTVVSVLQFDVSDIVSHFLQIMNSSSDVMSSLQLGQDNRELKLFKYPDVTWIVTLTLVEMLSTSFLSKSVNSIFKSRQIITVELSVVLRYHS